MTNDAALALESGFRDGLEKLADNPPNGWSAANRFTAKAPGAAGPIGVRPQPIAPSVGTPAPVQPTQPGLSLRDRLQNHLSRTAFGGSPLYNDMFGKTPLGAGRVPQPVPGTPSSAPAQPQTAAAGPKPTASLPTSAMEAIPNQHGTKLWQDAQGIRHQAYGKIGPDGRWVPTQTGGSAAETQARQRDLQDYDKNLESSMTVGRQVGQGVGGAAGALTGTVGAGVGAVPAAVAGWHAGGVAGEGLGALRAHGSALLSKAIGLSKAFDRWKPITDQEMKQNMLARRTAQETAAAAAANPTSSQAAKAANAAKQEMLRRQGIAADTKEEGDVSEYTAAKTPIINKLNPGAAPVSAAETAVNTGANLLGQPVKTDNGPQGALGALANRFPRIAKLKELYGQGSKAVSDATGGHLNGMHTLMGIPTIYMLSRMLDNAPRTATQAGGPGGSTININLNGQPNGPRQFGLLGEKYGMFKLAGVVSDVFVKAVQTRAANHVIDSMLTNPHAPGEPAKKDKELAITTSSPELAQILADDKAKEHLARLLATQVA